METKAELRQRMKATRGLIEPGERDRQTRDVNARVMAMVEFTAATTVMAFAALAEELSVGAVMEAAAINDAAVWLPRVEPHGLVPVRAGGPSVRSKFGVDEPTGLPADPAIIDLVIVPGLAFTAEGDRLGYGKAYYDRFLRQLRPDALAVGVCFAEQLLAPGAIPTEPHDVRVQRVVSGQPSS